MFSSLYFSFRKYVLVFNNDLNIFSTKINYNTNNQYLKFNNNFSNILKFLFILNYLVNYTFFSNKYKFINTNLYLLDNLLVFYFIKTFDNFILHFTKLSFLFEHFTTIYNLLRFDSKSSLCLIKNNFLGE